VQTGVLERLFTSSEVLIPGRYYKFYVQARNSVGYSESSEVITILAAQLPTKPQAPVTTLLGENMRITWTQPDDGGTPILSYRILIMQNDGVFVE
jgi:hypothetical protein